MNLRLLESLRAVAVFEAFKGAVVLAAGFGLLAAVHRDAQALAEALVGHLHLNPASHFPRIFIEAATALTVPRAELLALGAAVYVAVRFTEAWGLWYGRRWAEWFAAISGALYIPFEIYELAQRGGWLPAAALAANVTVVALVAMALLRQRRLAR